MRHKNYRISQLTFKLCYILNHTRVEQRSLGHLKAKSVAHKTCMEQVIYSEKFSISSGMTGRRTTSNVVCLLSRRNKKVRE
jgi:hypothetical protein